MGRRLGQHFLADRAVAERIADAAAVAPGEPLLEIGGGRGALTRHLVDRTDRFVVVELDPPLAEHLQATFGQRIELLHQDVVELDLAALPPGTGWVVAGNLPYYLTSPILVWLCRQRRVVDRAVVMVQAEVAERMAAEPGGKAFGRLSVLVQYHAEVETLFRVSPGAFRPPPKVHSAVVALRFRDQPAVAVSNEQRFFELVEHGFRWRRKTLSSVLTRWQAVPRDRAVAALDAAGVDPRRRTETLSLTELARLSEAVEGLGDADCDVREGEPDAGSAAPARRRVSRAGDGVPGDRSA